MRRKLLAGKFDKLERPENYYPTLQALNLSIFEIGSIQLVWKTIRSAIVNVVKTERILLRILPARGTLLPSKYQNSSKDLFLTKEGDNKMANHSNERVHLAFCLLFAAFASPSHPVVLLRRLICDERFF
jgi:hypothetical protein